MERIAVVILNWNGSKLLRQFLPGVVRCSQGERVRVYVADNGSDDDSLQVLADEFPTVRVIAMADNAGFAEGYNRALQQIDADYAVLLNSDVEVTEHWLEPMLEYMDAHPEVAACQPKICSWYDKSCFEYAGAAGGYIDKYGYPFCRGRIFDTVEHDNNQYDVVQPVFWATGAALFIRVSDYRKAGGLDGRFFAHMEEIDLCWRLRARGRMIVCVPASVVYHVGGGTLKQENPRKTYLNFRNNLLMLYKNLPADELQRIITVRMILDGVAALNCMLRGQWKHVMAIWKAHRDYRRMRPEFAAVREDNMSKLQTTAVAERMSYSIVWQYFVKGKRFFSHLPLTSD